MFSFRYHLVTICSVFLALALGLLLGAAIATSDLAQATSDDMVESMLSRYETLVDDNAWLEQELTDNSDLAVSLTNYWSDGRLDGRTIAVLLGNTLEDRSLQNDLSSCIRQAGGSVIEVTVLRTDFGLDDEDIRATLEKIVEKVPGEEYQQTLAKRLQKEWSYVYTTSSATPTQEDFNLPKHTYIQQTASDTSPESSGTSSVSGESNTSVIIGDGIQPQTAFQKIFYDQYVLTRALLSYRIISVSVDYSYLEEHTNPSPTSEQQAAFHIAESWQLPYGVTGLVNGLAQQQDEALMQTQVGLQITLSFQEAGTAGDLIYPTWLKSSIPKSTSGDVALPNYFALLIQPGHLYESMDILASENNLSCVTSPETVSGRYSIIALLTGAQAGIYGDDRSSENRFVPLPEDSSGRAAFR